MTTKDDLIARRDILVRRLGELETETGKAIDSYVDMKEKYDGLANDRNAIQRYLERRRKLTQNIDDHRKAVEDAVQELTSSILAEDD